MRRLAVRVQSLGEGKIGQDVFARTVHCEKEGFSVEDRAFSQIMDKELKKIPNGLWTGLNHYPS